MVSVLVTVYNRERYLPECLDSILASTFQDFELIIVDDASTDESWRIIEEYAHRDSRIIHHRNAANLGDYPNRNRAAGIARGKYVKYVDSDDLLYLHSLAIMVEAMEKYPEAALAISHSRAEDEQPYPWYLSSSESWKKEFLGSGCLGSGPTGAMIRRDAFNAVGGFGSWGVLGDTDLWYRLSRRYPIVLLPPGLAWWRRHESQEFNKENADSVYLERGFELVMQTLKAPDSPLSSPETAEAIARARQHHSRRLLSMALMRGEARNALHLARTAGLSASDVVSGLLPYK